MSVTSLASCRETNDEEVGAIRTLVIYHSEYGNTEKITRAIADALSEHGESRAVALEEVGALDAEALELVAVGAPTQRHGLPAPVRELLEATPEGPLRVAAAGVAARGWFQ